MKSVDLTLLISHHTTQLKERHTNFVREPEVVAKTMEKFVTFSICNLKFKDFLQFLKSSLDKLVKTQLLKLMISIISKNSWKKFKETTLPPKECFFSDLTKSQISGDDFQFIYDLQNTYCLQNMGELHDLCMETDVLLLADIFENFRKFSLTNYGLDPAHITSAPGLSWTAALKYTEVKLEIPRDPDMHIFIDKGLT